MRAKIHPQPVLPSYLYAEIAAFSRPERIAIAQM